MPTNAEIIRVFEKTLIGSYSCVDTRMAFDTDILLQDPKTEKVFFKNSQWRIEEVLLQNYKNG